MFLSILWIPCFKLPFLSSFSIAPDGFSIGPKESSEKRGRNKLLTKQWLSETVPKNGKWKSEYQMHKKDWEPGARRRPTCPLTNLLMYGVKWTFFMHSDKTFYYLQWLGSSGCNEREKKTAKGWETKENRPKRKTHDLSLTKKAKM